MVMTFAERLRQLRHQAGLYRHELAKRAAVGTNSIANWEQGICEPSWEAVQRLAAALGTDSRAFSKPTLEKLHAPCGPILPLRRYPKDSPAIDTEAAAHHLTSGDKHESGAGMTLGERLMELRHQAGLKQTALARRAGVTIYRLLLLEEDHVQPSWETVERLAAALGTDSMTFTATTLKGLKPPSRPIYRGSGRPRKPRSV